MKLISYVYLWTFRIKKKAVIGQNDLNISSRVLRRAHALLRSLGARNSWAILWRENLFLLHHWLIFHALENFWQLWLQLDPLNTALLLLKKVSCTFTKKKFTTSSPGAWRIGGRVRETGEEKVGDASPKRVGSERNKRNLRSIDNYFAMKKPRKQSREPGLQCTGGGRLAPPCSVPLPCFINTNCTNSIQHTNWLSALVFFFFSNIILHLLTKHILQLQNLKLKESIYRYYKLDQNYIKTRKKSTAVVIIRTITIDLLINRLFQERIC